MSGVILRTGGAIKMNDNIVNMDTSKLQPQLETIKKHSLIHYLQHKCAICGIKREAKVYFIDGNKKRNSVTVDFYRIKD